MFTWTYLAVFVALISGVYAYCEFKLDVLPSCGQAVCKLWDLVIVVLSCLCKSKDRTHIGTSVWHFFFTAKCYFKNDPGSTLRNDSWSTSKNDSGSTLKNDSVTTLKNDFTIWLQSCFFISFEKRCYVAFENHSTLSSENCFQFEMRIDSLFCAQIDVAFILRNVLVKRFFKEVKRFWPRAMWW